MPIFVLDTSIVFDLERGGLLEAAFRLEMTFIAPDFLYERELKEDIGPYLRGLGLQVVELDPDEVIAAQLAERQHKGLSQVDCSALLCARRANHYMLTGDGPLRTVTEAEGLPCSGLLWLLDRIHEGGLASPNALIEGLNRVLNNPRCRLPMGEVNNRLESWQREIDGAAPQGAAQ